LPNKLARSTRRPKENLIRVGAVVLHYRFWPGVRSTVEALLSQAAPPDHVVLVDNASNDGSSIELHRVSPDIEVIEAPVNLGYGGGMNLGIARLLGRRVDAILLLTHECRLAPDALAELVRRLEEESAVGAVGPLLAFNSKPDLVFSAGGQIEKHTWRPRHMHEPRLVSEWVGRPPHQTEWLDGAAVLLRSVAAREAGLLDEDYFLYFEEVEYFLRLRQLGWAVECVPAALAWQEPGTKPTYLWLRNRLRFLARTAPPRHVVREASRLAASIARNTVVPNPRLTLAERHDRRRALLHFLIRRWGPDTTNVGHR
jgi:GT2 family glycosyltransferase